MSGGAGRDAGKAAAIELMIPLAPEEALALADHYHGALEPGDEPYLRSAVNKLDDVLGIDLDVNYPAGQA